MVSCYRYPLWQWDLDFFCCEPKVTNVKYTHWPNLQALFSMSAFIQQLCPSLSCQHSSPPTPAQEHKPALPPFLVNAKTRPRLPPMMRQCQMAIAHPPVIPFPSCCAPWLPESTRYHRPPSPLTRNNPPYLDPGDVVSPSWSESSIYIPAHQLSPTHHPPAMPLPTWIQAVSCPPGCLKSMGPLDAYLTWMYACTSRSCSGSAPRSACSLCRSSMLRVCVAWPRSRCDRAPAQGGGQGER